MVTRKALTKKHGTPAEFERAIWEAYNSLMITLPEAQKAIQNYKNEWYGAKE